VGETKSEPPKIKVVDRRKFSAEGDPLEAPAPAAEEASEAAATAASLEEPAVEPEAPVQEPDPVPPPKGHRAQPSQDFLELVTMLAGQAELLLVGAEDIPAQPAEAQRLINYLGVLEEKTAGNLTDDESKVLSSVLYQLRTFFLQRK
jgi:hypothetical protein